MKRLFWLGLGVAYGVVATGKSAEAALRLTPSALWSGRGGAPPRGGGGGGGGVGGGGCGGWGGGRGGR